MSTSITPNNTNIRVVTINTPGPRGPQGPVGPTGSTDSVWLEIGTTATTSYDIQITGSLLVSDGIISFRPIKEKSTNFDLNSSDAGYYMHVGGNITCSITITNDSNITIGSEFDFFQTGSGNFLIVTESGIAFRAAAGANKIQGQYSAATIKKTATSQYDFLGNIIT